jgi:hypothetical protein
MKAAFVEIAQIIFRPLFARVYATRRDISVVCDFRFAAKPTSKAAIGVKNGVKASGSDV